MAELLGGKVTIFAGAGISTESRNVLKFTFYETVAFEMLSQHDLTTSSLSFPELMEQYCRQPNGRIKLLKKIKDRFEHIDSFPELKRSATRFHRELGTFFPMKNIITTNWDTYFEDLCEATPFVSDPDLAFWEAANRRVLKIHGSVSNFGSIVATESDYKECQERLNSGVIGAFLKTILATQTIIFIGYSLSDPDFSAIYDFIKKQMNALHKQAYVVTPFAAECEKFKAAGLIPIQTDGAYFLSQIKAHATAQGIMLDDDIYEAAAILQSHVFAAHCSMHENIKIRDCPQLMFAASYQDGMLHALERAIAMRGTGEYSHRCRIKNVINTYLELQKKKLRRGKYEDVAYIEGYVNGLTYLLMDKNEIKIHHIPLYFMFGIKHDIFDLTDFLTQIKRAPDAHKASYKYALKYLKDLPVSESEEFHHPPWL